MFKSELQRVDLDSLELPWEQELQQGLEREEMVKPRAQSWATARGGVFSGLSSGLWWFGNPGLGYNACMDPDGVDFAVSAGKYHNHVAKALGMPLLSCWVLVALGCPCSGLQFAVG